MTPTQRSLAYLRKQGWRVAIVEHWNAHARIRQDLFGFIDLLAICPTERPMGVQTTTSSNLEARVNKALALPVCREVLRGGFTLAFHGWDGKKLAVREIILDRERDVLRVL